MTTLFFDPDARDEFLEAADYYEKCRAGLGKIFCSDVEAATKNILLKLLSGSVSLHAPFRICLISKFPFSIIDTIESDHIRIIAVAHTKRKPGYWLSRAEK
ncbi:MAG: hypothetical protein J7L69_00960 [Desulfobulbaceae bacterium]|nr:hypothetical protein [Desulfobulbaceae bacterium]